MKLKRVKREKDWNGDEIDPDKFKGEPEFDIFEARTDKPTDQAFLRSCLTPSLIDRLQLYSYGFDGKDWVIEDRDPKKVYDTVVHAMTNLGMPFLVIPPGGADYNGRGQLYIKHLSEGDGMEPDRNKALMPHLYRLWGKSVYLEATTQEVEEVSSSQWSPSVTEIKSYRVVYSCSDGKNTEIEKI